MAKPTAKELKEFCFIQNIHKCLVTYLGIFLNDTSYSDHDMSKFSPDEIEAYTLKFVSLLPNDKNPGWEKAVTHHFYNNDHHAEYWRHLNLPMPKECISEAVIDMLAAKFQYQLCPNIVESVRVNSYEIDETKLIKSLQETMKDNPDFFTFKEHFISLYTSDEKNFINEELSRHKQKVYEQYSF